MNPRSESQMPGNYPVIQSPVGNGTELWGERPGYVKDLKIIVCSCFLAKFYMHYFFV